MAPALRPDRGFSLVEVLMATSLFLVLLASVFRAVHPANGAFRVEPERADIEQRLRAATGAISRDLLGAGSGLSRGENSGPLGDVLAPVLPFRQGRRNADPPGRFRTDAITLLGVAGGSAQSSLAQPLGARSASVQVLPDPGCPSGDPVCGFRRGMDVVVFDGSGAYDTFTIASVQGVALNLQHNLRDSSRVYLPATTRIAEATSRTYYLKTDSASDGYQLMQYDGAGGADVPVVDHVVALSFEYRGDPQPPQMIKALTEPSGPWTSYGPTPPASGENCVFTANGTPWPTPKLAVLGGGPAGLVPLGAAELTDGPWCPDALDPNRYDADLLRIRSVAVTLRVESAQASLRGPAGRLFARGGTSRSGFAFAPDREARIEVAPRNLDRRR